MWENQDKRACEILKWTHIKEYLTALQFLHARYYWYRGTDKVYYLKGWGGIIENQIWICYRKWDDLAAEKGYKIKH